MNLIQSYRHTRTIQEPEYVVTVDRMESQTNSAIIASWLRICEICCATPRNLKRGVVRIINTVQVLIKGLNLQLRHNLNIYNLIRLDG